MQSTKSAMQTGSDTISRTTNEVNFTIQGKVIPKARPRVVNGHAYTPQRTNDYEQLVRASYYKAAGNRRFREGVPLTVYIEARFAIPKSTPKKRLAEMDGALYMGRPDCDNIAKSVLDALNGVAFADDSQVVSLAVVKKRAQTASVFISMAQVYE